MSWVVDAGGSAPSKVLFQNGLTGVIHSDPVTTVTRSLHGLPRPIRNLHHYQTRDAQGRRYHEVWRTIGVIHQPRRVVWTRRSRNCLPEFCTLINQSRMINALAWMASFTVTPGRWKKEMRDRNVTYLCKTRTRKKNFFLFSSVGSLDVYPNMTKRG